MYARVLLNELGKNMGCEALPGIISVFLDAFNKVSNTAARMQDSVCHMTQKSRFIVKTSPLENATFVWT